jgi:hypothetical protein
MTTPVISVMDREEEKKARQDLAYAGGALLLRGQIREGFALMLASQALYSTQLSQVMGALEAGEIEEAAWLAAGYSHHPGLEKRQVFRAPEGGWGFLHGILTREGLSHHDPEVAPLYALAHTAHLGEATALYTVYERKGLKAALQLAGSIMDNRNVGYRYGLHAVSGPVGKGKT